MIVVLCSSCNWSPYDWWMSWTRYTGKCSHFTDWLLLCSLIIWKFPLLLCCLKIVQGAVLPRAANSYPYNMLICFGLLNCTIACSPLCPCMLGCWPRTNQSQVYRPSNNSWTKCQRWKYCAQNNLARCLTLKNLSSIRLVLLGMVGASMIMTHFLLLIVIRLRMRQYRSSWAPC